MGRVIGIVGSEQAKFTPETEASAREHVRSLLSQPGVDAACSGHCHLGGVDIFAEEEAAKMGLKCIQYAPKTLSWNGGYKDRNMLIALNSTEVHCITVKTLPESYTGMRFALCYHCGTKDHVKSGGCWTVKYAMVHLKKPGSIIVV